MCSSDLDGRLSAGHAKALLGTSDRAFQEQLARRASTEQWSVRAVEEAIRDRGGDVAPGRTSRSVSGGSSSTSTRQAAVLEIEGLLGEYLATRVTVKVTNKTGQVVIDYADLEDLERIYRLITEGPSSD